MANETKKFAGLQTLQAFLDNCKNLFALITHKHKTSDLEDYVVDSELSSTSTNPVQNKVISTEFEAVSEAMNVLESEIDSKISDVNSAISTHTGNSNIHVTTTNKSNWNSAYTHSTSTHAPSDSEKNIIVGVQKNGVDVSVDSSTRKVNITVPTTAAEVGAASEDHNHDDDYDEKGAANTALNSAKAYTDSVAANVKDDLLNGAGEAYDTLKELGDLIDDNHDAIDALEIVATGKADVNHRHNYYGICSTGASTKAKVVTIDGFELVEGAMVIIKFENANSASSPTLNVNDTGAFPMYRYGTTAVSTGTTSTGWYAGAIQVFIYDGTGWVRDYWYNTTYTNAGLGQVYVTCSTAEGTLAKTASSSSYALTTGGIVAVKFTNAVPANATLNINSKGAKAMYYRGAAITGDVIVGGDVATFIYDGTYYHLLSIDRWQEDIENIKTNYYTKAEIDNVELITIADIDTICGGSIQYAEEVLF